MASSIQSAGDGVSATFGAHATQSSGFGSQPPLPMRAGSLSLADLIHLFMRHYAGRDCSLMQRLSWWSSRIGTVSLQDLCDDHVHEGLEQLAAQQGRYFSGHDVEGNPIFRGKKRPLSPATINRYLAALAAVVSWSIKKRIAPKGLVHPCRGVARRPENNEKTRFLTNDERQRLLSACRLSPWPRLYLLVLLALTTGARKGELMSLCWSALDLERAIAYVGMSKNGDPRVLPLVPIVVMELRRFSGVSTALVFQSTRRPDKSLDFSCRWADALEVAKINNFRFHDLRHSCASQLAQSGATLLEIADVLGHRQLQVTKRYSHLTTHHKALLINRVLGNLQ